MFKKLTKKLVSDTKEVIREEIKETTDKHTPIIFGLAICVVIGISLLPSKPLPIVINNYNFYFS